MTLMRWMIPGWLLRKIEPPLGVILMYHRIASEDFDPWRLCVTPEHFEEQLQVLNRLVVPLRMTELVEGLRHRNVPERSAVLTFDDGYADNLYAAAPLLEAYGIPATVFVVSGQLGVEKEFWWDSLGRALLQPGTLPTERVVETHLNLQRHELLSAETYSHAEYDSDRRRRPWESGISARYALYYEVWRRLGHRPQEERLAVVEQMLGWTGEAIAARATHRALSVEELRLLSDSPMIDIGAHTVSHPFLGRSSTAQQRAEIEESKRYLDELLGIDVKSFSFPHGSYNQTTLTSVREAGFMAACTVHQEAVTVRSNAFQLPRFEVQDWSGDEFEKRLRHWLRL